MDPSRRTVNPSLPDQASFILERIGATGPVRVLQEALTEGARWIRVGRVVGSAAPMLALLLRRALGRPVLLVTPREHEAEGFRDDLIWLGGDRVSYLPPAETIPYRREAPSAEAAGERLEALLGLREGIGLLVTSSRVLVEPVVSPEEVAQGTLILRQATRVDREQLSEGLVRLGYRRVPLVEEIGSFSRRGGILDIYGFGMEEPVRLELVGDRLESLRSFDLLTQRSTECLTDVRILPAREWVNGSGEVSLPWQAAHGTDDTRLLLEHLPAESVVVLVGGERVWGEVARFWQEVKGLYREASREGANGLRAPAEVYVSPRDLEGWLARYQVVQVEGLAQTGVDRRDEGLAVDLGAAEPEPVRRQIGRLRGVLRNYRERGFETLLLSESGAQRDRLAELLGPAADAAHLHLAVGRLSGGFVLPDAALAVLTEWEIFERRRVQRSRRYQGMGASLDSLASLKPGDYVVHLDYGIGRYLALKRLSLHGGEEECLALEYAGGDRLYVPLHQLSQIEKYQAGEGSPPRLHRLGGSAWERLKARTAKAIADMAEELLTLSAIRQLRSGHAFSPDTEWQQEVEAAFPYQETPDQARAIEEVKADLEEDQSMDRLLCGDVGFGKTEVAVRAAFKVVQDSRQVAVLVPTTVLASQHLATFMDRLEPYPVRIELLSRFLTPREQRRVLEDLAAGRADVVIGTHRLFSPDVKFRDLGLVIIDEEHRFGVRHKERFKTLRQEVDVLSLSATPIPRTLHMSLMGLRDVSVITTPPRGRQPIVTYVTRFDPEVIVDAVLREVDRGGQVFFVHNLVETIDRMASYLRRLLPEIRLGVAHGQLSERELERVMLAFYRGQIDVLVTSMIIEAGLDVPNANTLLINRADRFGLAQLYQLRGRIGRSDRRAYAYFLIPPQGTVSEEAERRLRILEEYTELGSGYKVALKDLELRGAGDILGSRQHGFIDAVGFETYCRLLETTVARMRGQVPEADREVQMSVQVPAYLPSHYVEDEAQRVQLYRRLAGLRDPGQVDDLAEELRDRYGLLPEPARNLLTGAELKGLAVQAGVARVELGANRVRLTFEGEPAHRLVDLAADLSEEIQSEVVQMDPLVLELRGANLALAASAAGRILTGLVEQGAPASVAGSHE